MATAGSAAMRPMYGGGRVLGVAGLLVSLALVVVMVGCEGQGPGIGGHPRPLVLLIGDSTTAGYSEGGRFVRWAGPAPLQALRFFAPARSPWRQMEVVNLAVPGTTTRDWAVRMALCGPRAEAPGQSAHWQRLLARACADRTGLASAVRGVLARVPAAALVALGTNDPLRGSEETPEVALDHLRVIAQALAPARVLVASPFWTSDRRRGPFVDRLAVLLREGGMLTGPNFAAMRLPLGPSGVHLTRASYIAAAVFWLGALTSPPVVTNGTGSQGGGRGRRGGQTLDEFRWRPAAFLFPERLAGGLRLEPHGGRHAGGVHTAGGPIREPAVKSSAVRP